MTHLVTHLVTQLVTHILTDISNECLVILVILPPWEQKRYPNTEHTLQCRLEATWQTNNRPDRWTNDKQVLNQQWTNDRQTTVKHRQAMDIK